MVGIEAARGFPPLAVTKLRPPKLAGNVLARPRIDAVLDAAVRSSESMALVSAPAGAGKSTLLAHWLNRRDDLSSIWVQLDSGDNDAIRFWTGIITGLASLDEALPERFIPALRAPKTKFGESALPVLVNTLDEIDTLVIVLDDYHIISNPDVHDGVQSLIDTLPDHVTLVLSSRIDPPLRLGKLRVSGRLTEIRATDLRFDATEALCFFDNKLAAEDIDVLCERTEGWAAGLVLAASSLARSTDPQLFVQEFAGDDRLVVDYLATELWVGLDAQTAGIMLATSILDQMCGPLVDALVGGGGGAKWLEQQLRNNQLLISLDENRHWYRYHHLLSDLLRSELARTETTRVTELHRCAAKWYLANDAPDSAIQHMFAAGDLDGAADIVGTRGSKLFSEGELSTVQGWLDMLGKERVSQHAWCSVLQVWTFVVAGEFDRVADSLDTAESLIAAGAGGDDTPLLAGSIAAVSAVTAIERGDVSEALNAAERIVASPDEHEVTALVSGIVGICRAWAGQFDLAETSLQSSAKLAPTEGEHLIACTSMMFLAILAVENDDFGRARHCAQQSLAHARAHHLTEYHQIALAHSILASCVFNETASDAFGHADRGVMLARRSSEPIMLAYALATRAEISTLAERIDAASIDLAEARNLLSHCADPGIVLTFVARREAHLGATHRVASKRPSTALVDDLTDRELTIVRLLPSKLTVREIGNELHVSHNTVKGHIKAIYRKLGVNDRSLAVQRARELHLL